MLTPVSREGEGAVDWSTSLFSDNRKTVGSVVEVVGVEVELFGFSVDLALGILAGV
jgi:hypothetical protein